MVKEEFFKIARWFIIRCIQKSEEIFKHSACGTGGWNEFHNGMAFVDIAIPCGNIFSLSSGVTTLIPLSVLAAE